MGERIAPEDPRGETEVFVLLRIRQLKHLAHHLGTTVDYLEKAIAAIPRCCEELELRDPRKPGTVRHVLNVTGSLRKVQDKMLREVLFPNLQSSIYSHGGVRGRDIKSNASAHIGSRYAFVTDISSFYPSVSHFRVYRLFVGRFGCSPNVARVCTRLCTVNHHLALGLPTSPILADQLLMPIDKRIAGACEKLGLIYTRFVDDLAISGAFDLSPEKCGIPALIERILGQHGFVANATKQRFGKLADGFAITRIRVHNGHLDVRRDYYEEVLRQIEDARNLAAGGDFCGPYFTQAQITGRVRFICWINPGRKRQVMPLFRSIPWSKVDEQARNRGLIASRTTLRPIAEPRY